jgi:hypothetical protein
MHLEALLKARSSQTPTAKAVSLRASEAIPHELHAQLETEHLLTLLFRLAPDSIMPWVIAALNSTSVINPVYINFTV